MARSAAVRPRVAVDARRLQDRPLLGVGRGLANTLPLVAEEADLVLLTDARHPRPDTAGLEDTPCVDLAIPNAAPESVWLHLRVAHWLRSWDGLFHGTFNAIPFVTSTPSVVTIHDLSFEHHPEGQSAAKQRLFQAQARVAARRARRILTVSETVRRDLAATYGIDPSTILVGPNAVDPVFHPRADTDLAPTLARLGVTTPYVVALGGAPRRGLPVAIEAWHTSGAADRGVGLVVVDNRAPAPRRGLHWVGRMDDDDDWASLLCGAEAFCYATRFEGFGMPALEAAASGTPVVCARLDVLVEVLGDAAQWCQRPVVDDLAAGLRDLLDDPGRCADLRRAGLDRAARAPGWDRAAETTLRAYHEAGR